MRGARDLPAALVDKLRQAIADPNSVIPRGYSPTLTDWQVAAIFASGAIVDAAQIRRDTAEQIAQMIDPGPFSAEAAQADPALVTRATAAAIAREIGTT